MFKILKIYNWIIASSFICIFLGIMTFLTFINRGFIPLTSKNLQYLLSIDALLLTVFFYLIYKNTIKIFHTKKNNGIGRQTNLKYISLFSLFTFIPSLLVAIFSLLIFNFGIQNFFNDKITNAVNNSYDVAKNYLEENKKNVELDVILMSVGINRTSNLFYSDLNRFKNIVRSEKILRRIDDIYLIDSLGNIIFSDTRERDIDFIIPSDEEFTKVLEGKPVTIQNNVFNKTSVMIKLNTLIDTYLYISRNIDLQILEYINETQEAVNFYYSVENSQTGIKITFAIIYIIVVTLLLFLSTVIVITFARRLTKPIINLIAASENISKGKLDAKVPNIETDTELGILNNNFNNMIDKLKIQQDKLLVAERYVAWESIARKLAHEIKNPLTPIQLSIDRIQEKYSEKITENKEDFKKYLETINRQIKDIENLANEFSNFARMPEPKMKKINFNAVLKRATDFFKMSSRNNIKTNFPDKNLLVNGDEEQLYRVFINLIKNSEESIDEKRLKNSNLEGKIDVEIKSNKDYISVILIDNGTGISDTKKVMTPYYTTKKKGSGLGLPIVSKIIYEHSGELIISNNKEEEGTVITISIPTI